MEPIIKLLNVTYTYPGANAPSLRNVSLDIERGDFLAVIGGNGSGKSTLCKAINGLIPHFIEGDFEGAALVGGVDTRAQKIGDLALKVGYVYQDFENQIVCPTVLEDASFACLNYAMPDYDARGREALRLTGLSAKEESYIWQLSGGQKHLLALAGAVSLCPEILILDEPAAQLDPAHARMIYEVLKDLNQNHGKTIIVIEHHTEYIARYCKHAVLLKDGEIRWKRPAREALRCVDELVESNIFPPQVTLAARALQNAGVLAGTVLPTTLDEGLNVFGGVKMRMPVKQAETVRPGAELVASFRGVSAGYRAVKGKSEPVIRDFSLDIRKGDKIALIGGNGAGKSTLMKMLIGLVKPIFGAVSVGGLSAAKATPEELAKIVSLVYQNPEEMFIMDSIRADVEYAMKVRGVQGYAEKAEELLSMFRLSALGERDGRLLSGGQMRRASLAIGVALKPTILLLDEPTANLDIATRKEIIKALAALSEQVETVVIATHDMQLVSEWANRIIVLSAGALLADGNRGTVFGDESLAQRSGIRPPEIYEMSRLLFAGAKPCYTVNDFVACFRREEPLYDLEAVGANR